MEARLKATEEALSSEKTRVEELELALKRKRADDEEGGDDAMDEDWGGPPAAKKGRAAAAAGGKAPSSTVCQSFSLTSVCLSLVLVSSLTWHGRLTGIHIYALQRPFSTFTQKKPAVTSVDILSLGKGGGGGRAKAASAAASGASAGGGGGRRERREQWQDLRGQQQHRQQHARRRAR